MHNNRPLSFFLPALLAAVLLLTGCGLTQSVGQGTGKVARAIFYKKVETLHLQLVARAALNNDEAQMATPVEVRLWPLRNTNAFRQASYRALLKQDSAVLANDLSGQPITVRVMPDNSVSVTLPLADDVQAVAIAAFFLYPDRQKDSWRLIIPRNEMDADHPTMIELNNRELQVRGSQ